ncbi:ppsA, partial [Symbiodinium sp. KB8]
LVLSTFLNVSPACFVNFCLRGLTDVRGRCFAFDSSAKGLVRGEGSAALVLRRLFGTSKEGSDTDVREGLVRAVEMIQHLACKPNRTQGWFLEEFCDVRLMIYILHYLKAMQETVDLALARSSCRAYGIDWVECHAAGDALADALEARACWVILDEGSLRRSNLKGPPELGQCISEIFRSWAPVATLMGRVALLVGNDYPDEVGKLQHAVSDMKACEEALANIGFRCMTCENQPRSIFLETFADFLQFVRDDDDTVLFNFNGHCKLVDEKPALIFDGRGLDGSGQQASRHEMLEAVSVRLMKAKCSYNADILLLMNCCRDYG